MMRILNNPLLAAFLLILFLWLSAYALSHEQKASNAEVNAFIAKQLAEYKHPKPMNQAQALYEIWGLVAEDATKPVDIFAENGERL